MLTHAKETLRKTVLQHYTYTLIKSHILLIIKTMREILKVKNGCKFKLFTNKVYKIKAAH